MKLTTYRRPAALLLALPLLSLTAARAATSPALGTAGTFAVLAGTTVTNTGPTTLIGDLGVSPGTAATGFPPGLVTGMIHTGTDAVAVQAQKDAAAAYTTAAGQPCDVTLTGQDLGGKTLTPGVYCFASSAQLTGQLILDGQGNPSSVFIFQIGSTLTTASNASVVLINGAQPCSSNIFWQVGSSATLGTRTSFTGNILALASITLNTGTVTNGGLYAQTGAVTLERVHKPPTCPPHVLIDPRIRWCHPHTILRPPAVTRRSAPAPAPFLRVSNRTRVAGASSGGPRNHRCGPRWVENETWELGGLWTRS